MYKSYVYPEINPRNVWVCGDSHGQWGLLEFKIKESGLKDAIIIIAGDCGIGFERPQFYQNVYNRMKKTLTKSNVTVLFVRGNHDNPSFYDGEKINFTYFKAIPDYSIITVGQSDLMKNILCIGGGITIDRMKRIELDRQRNLHTQTPRESYWSDEWPKYKPDIIDEINNDGFEINFVVTHTAPNFAPPVLKNNIEYWLANDINLASDIDKERLILTQIYNHLVKDKHPIEKWFYGHFHQHSIYVSEDSIEFRMLDLLWEKNNSWDICPIIFG